VPLTLAPERLARESIEYDVRIPIRRISPVERGALRSNKQPLLEGADGPLE